MGSPAATLLLLTQTQRPNNPPLATLTDDFATADTAKWTFGSSATVTGGQLSLGVDSGYSGAAGSVAAYDLTGSSATVQLAQAANLGNGTTETVFYLYTTPGNVNDNAVFFDVTGSGTATMFLAVYRTVGGVRTLVVAPNYDPVAHRWLRIRESAGTVYWDTSPDRATWTNVGTWSPTFSITALYAQLGGGYYGTEPSPGTAVFDNFNVAPAGTPATAAGSITLGGTATARTTTAAAGTITLGGSVTAQARSTASGVMVLGGTATAASTASASGSITLGGTAVASARVTSSGAIVFGGTSTATASASTSGTVTLGGSVTALVPATAAGPVTLSGLANATAAALPPTVGPFYASFATDGAVGAAFADQGGVAAAFATVPFNSAAFADDGRAAATFTSDGAGSAAFASAGVTSAVFTSNGVGAASFA